MNYSDLREPYPDDLINCTGLGFLLGGIYGPTHHLIKGIYNSPKGQRLVDAARAVHLNAPRVSSRFAVRFGVFSIFDSILFYARDQKEDPCNIIVAGAATGGVLKLRHGVRATSRSALIGGGTLALIRGLSVLLERHAAPEVKYVAGKDFSLKEPEPTPLSKF